MRPPPAAANVSATAPAVHLCISSDPFLSSRQPSNTLNMPWSSAPMLCTIWALMCRPLPSTSQLRAVAGQGSSGQAGGKPSNEYI